MYIYIYMRYIALDQKSQKRIKKGLKKGKSLTKMLKNEKSLKKELKKVILL